MHSNIGNKRIPYLQFRKVNRRFSYALDAVFNGLDQQKMEIFKIEHRLYQIIIDSFEYTFKDFMTDIPKAIIEFQCKSKIIFLNSVYPNPITK